MNDLIKDQLKEIEENFQVKILYAVESGSRAWGFPSKDSDFDVRFIYIHRPEWYLSIDPQGVGTKKDVIELPINDLLDISGWEITKALRLFRKSNPSLLEWMGSPILYYQTSTLIDQLRGLESEVFDSKASLHHYLNMAKNNFGELQGSEVKMKRYLYALRAVFSCKWIERSNTAPPIDFQELLTEIVPDGLLKNRMKTLLERKMAGDELDYQHKIQVINDYLDHEIMSIEAYIQTIRVKNENPTPRLDELFRATLKEVWE
ncbi:nucleotidyltransferase domain-containing protein [Sporosarcina sp. HYO08]|uniref:nucleotidyltransferase domain-containing protein n=1 Tax=Sporosarcina sp. HYO08 TaxID=1759557 RepID=UPI0007932564|nr:nucleotidyltransferase domain-containing protein [Sporosarcina sp. HYO08]KXH80626.1 hypothetical protein AU377_07720 [Sporosarcina sp. HYO08]